MYALASSWRRLVQCGLRAFLLAFCVAGAALGALCLDFAWQVQHFRLPKGSDVRPGVVLASFGAVWAPGFSACILRRRRSTWCSVFGFCVAGAASSGVPWAPAFFASMLHGRRGTKCSVFRFALYVLDHDSLIITHLHTYSLIKSALVSTCHSSRCRFDINISCVFKLWTHACRELKHLASFNFAIISTCRSSRCPFDINISCVFKLWTHACRELRDA